MKKIIIILVLIAAAVGITFFIKPGQIEYRQGLFTVNEEVADKEIVWSDYVRAPVKEDGLNALQATEKYTQVGTKQFDFGVFVESVNGIKPDEKHFWKLYMNGQGAQVGADQLETKKGDIVEWVLEEIKE